MKKLKTRRSAAKRFKRTATGHLKARKAGHSHLLSSKDRKRKRRLKRPTIIKSGSALKRVNAMMPYK